jgi:hypothetical protein
MDAERLYTRYHRLVVTMAEADSRQHSAALSLQDLLARFDREIASLSDKDRRWVKNELAEQFDQRLLRTTSAPAREIFALASKHLE